MFKSIEKARENMPKNATSEELIINIVHSDKSYNNFNYRDVTFTKWWLVVKGYEEENEVWYYYSPFPKPGTSILINFIKNSASSVTTPNNIIFWKRDTEKLIGDINEVIMISNIPVTYSIKSKTLPTFITLTKGIYYFGLLPFLETVEYINLASQITATSEVTKKKVGKQSKKKRRDQKVFHFYSFPYEFSQTMKN